MFCQHCGTKVNRDDSFCPNCGTRIIQTPGQLPADQAWQQPGAGQTNFPGQEAPRKNTGLVLALVAGVLLIVGLGTFFTLRFLAGKVPSPTGSETTTTPVQTTVESIPSETTATLQIGLGEAGIIDGLAIIIDQARLLDQEDFLTGPEEGYDYIQVWYTLVNRDSKSLKTPRLDQLLLVHGRDRSSPSGYDQSPSDEAAAYLFDEEETYLPGQDLAPGQSFSGWLIYQKSHKAKTITVHYYQGRDTTSQPDLVISFPASALLLPPSPAPTPPDPTTTSPDPEQKTALAEYLVGQWAEMPDEFGNTFVYAFMANENVGIASAYSYYESDLETWDDDETWFQDIFSWVSWWLEEDVLVFAYGDTRTRLLVTPEEDDIVLFTYLDTQEQLALYRVAEEPTLEDFLIGIWLPDEADSEGIYDALTFGSENTFLLTSSWKLAEDASAADWPQEVAWEILDFTDGSWWLDYDHVLVSLGADTFVYEVEIEGPDHCTISFYDNWTRSYSRVESDY